MCMPVCESVELPPCSVASSSFYLPDNRYLPGWTLRLFYDGWRPLPLCGLRARSNVQLIDVGNRSPFQITVTALKISNSMAMLQSIL